MFAHDRKRCDDMQSFVGNGLFAEYLKEGCLKVKFQSQGCQAGSILQRLSGLQAAATSWPT